MIPNPMQTKLSLHSFYIKTAERGTPIYVYFFYLFNFEMFMVSINILILVAISSHDLFI